jgi:ribA/ribD-fused uncharacterized protein
MTDAILGFFGEYHWLSNFDESRFTIDDRVYLSNEHWYQANKATNEQDYDYVCESISPGVSKQRGRRIQCIKNWEEVKNAVMWQGLVAKFTQNSDLKAKLLATGDAYLEETNFWGDKYWGVSHGTGKNILGKQLMALRTQLRNEELLYGSD